MDAVFRDRFDLLDLFRLYVEHWSRVPHASSDATWETTIVHQFTDFIRSTPDCLERTSPNGHLTGSALVTDAALGKVLLTHHRKLGLWIQLGGHADGHLPLHEVSLREANEESGLQDLSLFDLAPLFGTAPGFPLPFDLDVHRVPARDPEGPHLHFDVRYLVLASTMAPLTVTEESHGLGWFTVPEARRLTSERSMHRLFDKLEWVRDALLQPRPSL